jgi:hypothetical protein
MILFIINSIIKLIKEEGNRIIPLNKCRIYYFFIPYFIDIGEYIIKHNIQDKKKLPSWMIKCGIIWDFCITNIEFNQYDDEKILCGVYNTFRNTLLMSPVIVFDNFFPDTFNEQYQYYDECEDEPIGYYNQLMRVLKCHYRDRDLIIQDIYIYFGKNNITHSFSNDIKNNLE